MLITQLKAKETIVSLAAGKKVFIINCHGCKEVRFPEKEAVELQKELSAEGNVTFQVDADHGSRCFSKLALRQLVIRIILQTNIVYIFYLRQRAQLLGKL